MAFGGQTFCHRLQVGHQLGIVSDVLPHLVHKKIKTEVDRLLVQPRLDLVAEVFDRDAVLSAVLVQDALGQRKIFAGDLGIGAGDVSRFQQSLFSATLPGFVRVTLIGGLKRIELPPAV
ncbi:hypothetical protein D9M72_368440 [compost metagenome]